MKTREINSGVVTAISGTDLVTVCDAGGALRPISFANLAKAIRDTISIGGRNILLDSRNISSLPKTLDYAQTCKPVEGDRLAVTLYGTYSGAGNIRVFLVSSNGGDGIVDLTKVDDGVYFGHAMVKSDVANPRVLITANKADSTTSYSIEKVIMTYGNALSAWSAAPEDSRGGVIGYQSITYNSVEKGGTHADQGTVGRTEISADDYLAFGSLDAMCECLGRASENLFGCAVEGFSSLRGRGYGTAGMDADKQLHTESSCGIDENWWIPTHSSIRFGSKASVFLLLDESSFSIWSETVFGDFERQVGRLGEVDVKAGKEVAA